MTPVRTFFVGSGATRPAVRFSAGVAISGSIAGNISVTNRRRGDEVELRMNGKATDSSCLVLGTSTSRRFSNERSARLLKSSLLSSTPTICAITSSRTIVMGSLPRVCCVPLNIITGGSRLIDLGIRKTNHLSSPLCLCSTTAQGCRRVGSNRRMGIRTGRRNECFLARAHDAANVRSTRINRDSIGVCSPTQKLVIMSGIDTPLLGGIRICALSKELITSEGTRNTTSIDVPMISATSPRGMCVVGMSVRSARTAVAEGLSLH